MNLSPRSRVNRGSPNKVKVRNLEETTVKVSKRNHDLVRQVADKTGLGVKQVLDTLIEQGLNATKEVGAGIAPDGISVKKIQNEVDKLKQSYHDIATRVNDIETEVSDQGGAAVELTQEDLLQGGDHEPGKEVLDHTVYYCKACARQGKTVYLDPKDQPGKCPECGAKLIWKDGTTDKVLGYLGLGIMALAFFANRTKAVSKTGISV